MRPDERARADTDTHVYMYMCMYMHMHVTCQTCQHLYMYMYIHVPFCRARCMTHETRHRKSTLTRVARSRIPISYTHTPLTGDALLSQALPQVRTPTSAHMGKRGGGSKEELPLSLSLSLSTVTRVANMRSRNGSELVGDTQDSGPKLVCRLARAAL